MRTVSFIISLIFILSACSSNKTDAGCSAPLKYSQESASIEYDGCKVKGMITSTLIRFFTQTEGFEQVDRDDSTNAGILEFKGKFMDYDGCTLHAIYKSMYAGNTVEGLEILLPHTKDWNMVKNQYMAMKEMLTGQFGSPKRCNETMTESDFEKKHPDTKRPVLALKEGRCTYTSIFMAPDGTIVTLAIAYIPHTKAAVGISMNF